MPLKGKRVYITGGTGGMGIPLVALLRKQGAIVETYERGFSGDLVANIQTTMNRLREHTPDILINMAGYNTLAYCEDQDLESQIALNLLVPMKLAQAVLPEMKRRNAGHIVNIGSMTALIPLPHLTGYVSSKAGLKAFSDSLRRELSGTGIAVTHITPRAVNTNANKGIKAVLNERTGVHHDSPDAVAERIVKAILKRKSDVRIGFPERIFAILNALFPKLIDAGLQNNRRIGEELLNQTKSTKEIPDEKIRAASVRASR